MTRIRVGDELTTLGGWRARIIWVRTDGEGFYAVHKPDTKEEEVPVYHISNGQAMPIFAVCSPPCYGGHPADLIM